MLDDAFGSCGINEFYRSEAVKWGGKTKDMRKYYSDVAAEFLLSGGRPGILFFEGSAQHGYYKHIGEMTCLRDLMSKLGVKVFVIRRVNADGVSVPFKKNEDGDCCFIDAGNKPRIKLPDGH